MNPKQPKNKTLESDIQARIIARLKAEGWLCVKLVSTNLPGIPDLLMLKDGKARFIEVKRPGNKPEPLQAYRIAQLRKAGFEVEVLTE